MSHPNMKLPIQGYGCTSIYKDYSRGNLQRNNLKMYAKLSSNLEHFWNRHFCCVRLRLRWDGGAGVPTYQQLVASRVLAATTRRRFTTSLKYVPTSIRWNGLKTSWRQEIFCMIKLILFQPLRSSFEAWYVLDGEDCRIGCRWARPYAHKYLGTAAPTMSCCQQCPSTNAIITLIIAWVTLKISCYFFDISFFNRWKAAKPTRAVILYYIPSP